MLSARETSLKALRFLLDTTVVLREGAGAPFAASPGCIAVTSEELPLSPQNARKRFLPLFKRCSRKELDVLCYSISVYCRAGQAAQPKWDGGTWTALSICAQEVSVTVALEQLIEGANTQNTQDDLWSALYGSNQTQGILMTFLDRVSGWSPDGLEVPTEMLKRILSTAKETPAGRNAIEQVVTAAGAQIKKLKKPDDLMVKASKTFDGLDYVLAQPVAAEILSESLVREVKDSIVGLGDYFERNSFLSGLFSVTMVIDRLNPLLLRDEKYSCFTGLRNFPNFSWMDALNCHTHIQDGLHRCHKTVHVGLLKMLKSANRSNVLAWLSALVSLNELRAGPRFKRGKEALPGACSDGFMLNFCAVMLELCKPFFTSDPSGQKLALISANYATSPACRLDLHNEPCLVQGTIIAEERLARRHERFLPPDNSFKFVTECFYITQRALHVGLIPAIDTFSKTISDLNKQIQAQLGGEKILKDLHALYLLSWSCCLLDPQFVQYCSEFYITQAVWITRLLDSCRESGLSEEEVRDRQRKLLSGIPEHGVKDMSNWFRFVVLIRPILLQGLQVTPFVDCCVSLLERPDLLPSPLAQSRIVAVLLAFVDSDKRGRQKEQILGAESWGGILGELSVMVQASPTVQDHLGPALLHTYSAVHVVEGLDVDKENFDKYAARFEIAQLLHRLWRRPDCRESIIKECGSNRFQDFLGSVFDTLLYQLNDGLSRLVIVRNYEMAKDAGQWSSLNPIERREKEMFLAGEQRASRGFMMQSNEQLELLETMTESEAVAKCLCIPPLAKRTAAAMVGFLDTLCGPRASELKVKDMDKYSFDPRRLLILITNIMMRVWRQEGGRKDEEGFLVSLATHPDFSQAAMNKCAAVLQKQQLLDPQTLPDYTRFLQQIKPIVQESTAMQTNPSSSRVADWQQQVESIELDEEGLKEAYVAALEDSKYDGAELEAVHTLAGKAQQSLDPRSPKVKAIMREMKQLQEALPIHPDSAIFVRQDEDHMDLVRVLITGPVDTPYSRGCFVFDIYYPATYPTNPPIVIMTTTGGGTVRFNPNLYADGKVCLSLLGTWHGGDATEKWNPLTSNLLQVLLSIQGMIFIPDPMFNEPGYEAIRGSQEGNVRSTQYNADIQLYTIRYAMLEQLRNPPHGFEDVIQVHFAMQRDIILHQCSQWLQNAISPEHERKLRKAIDGLRTELDKL